jgi:branched-chain amino acid aminotransferase
MLQRQAAAQGYSQILWLLREGNEHYLTEVGTMNMCVYWINEQGKIHNLLCFKTDYSSMMVKY